MSRRDSSSKSKNPSHDSGAPPTVIAPGKEPNTSNPIILGVLGVVLVCTAGIGAWHLYTYPTAQAEPIITVQPAPAPEAAKSSDIVPAPLKASVNPVTPATSQVIDPPAVIREKAPKQNKPEAKKSSPKASVKETVEAIVPPKTLPVQIPDAGQQQRPEAPAPARPPQQPPKENDGARKQPLVTEQPVPPVTVTLGDGLPVRMLLVEDVPADAPEGSTVEFVIAADVQVDDKTVIHKGAVITASVAGRKKKFLGIGSGKVIYQLGAVHAVDGALLTVRATPRRTGEGMSTSQFEPPKGPEKKEFAALQGTEYVGYIDTVQTVSVRK